MMKKVDIYTDGACRNNPGPGGWGALLRFGEYEKCVSGFEPATTNNRMELTAAIEALKLLQEPCEVILTTDSQYVRQGISLWMAAWKKSGWRTKSKEPVKNQDLWQVLDACSAMHQIEWRWVKGHSGHVDNDRVDQLATHAIDIGLQKKGQDI